MPQFSPDPPSAPRIENGALRLFRLLGIDVSIHWSWAIVVFIGLRVRHGYYSSQVWSVIEFLTLFVVVLAHDFGHSLACRSVGGAANRILLWPLGGIAYVSPPPRPGAFLWSIAAGPLVNLVLLILSTVAALFSRSLGLPADISHYILAIWVMNLVLLGINLLPIYPLDGGQILQAILWFFIGRAKSLSVVSVIGLMGAAALLAFAVSRGSWWMMFAAGFAGLRAWGGLKTARAFAAIADAPKRDDFSCPRCQGKVPVGPFWQCVCRQTFDIFDGSGVCPHCRHSFSEALCTECQQWSHLEAFYPKGPIDFETESEPKNPFD